MSFSGGMPQDGLWNMLCPPISHKQILFTERLANSEVVRWHFI
jgi:hypothetical protein